METKNKYDNGKIYKLWSLETNEIYVGSTVQPLHKRLYEHRSKARQTPCSRVIYQEMNSLGIDSFSIELIEDYPCKSLNELHRREGHWIRELRATLNKFVAGRTGKEYREENKDKIHTYRKSWVQSNTEKLKEYRKEYNELNKDNLRAHAREYRCNNIEEKQRYEKTYRDNNKEKLAEKFKAYWESNKEKLAVINKAYRDANKEKLAEMSKVYREANKSVIAEKGKLYREQNKDTIAAKKNEKHVCHVCGGCYTTCHKALHERSAKHQRALLLET